MTFPAGAGRCPALLAELWDFAAVSSSTWRFRLGAGKASELIWCVQPPATRSGGGLT